MRFLDVIGWIPIGQLGGSHKKLAGAQSPETNPKLQRDNVGSVHMASVVQCGEQVDVTALVVGSVQVWQLLPVGHICPHAGE